MKAIKKFFGFLIILVILAVTGIVIYGRTFYEKKVSEEPLKTKISEIREGYKYVKKEDIPDYYFKAIVAVEDRRYYNHGPVDYIGIVRAIFRNLQAKDLQEGGSTITQQVAKNLYFESEKNVIKRKIAEVFVSIDLEKNYSKEEILELYVNIIYFGNGYYGIKDACKGYLNKEPKDMTLAEVTMMAGIPNAPSVYAPNVNKDLCKKRQKKVISSMLDCDYITKDEADRIDQSFIDKIK